MRVRAAALGLPLAVALLLAPACRVEGQSQDPEDELRLELQLRDADSRAPRQPRRGEPLEFVLIVHNPAAEPRRLAFSSAKTHDVTVSRADGEETWRASDGLVYIQMLTEIVLAPHGSHELTARWDVPSDAKPGQYRARGTVPAQSMPLATPEIEFTLE
jgi:hypothetical protein